MHETHTDNDTSDTNDNGLVANKSKAWDMAYAEKPYLEILRHAIKASKDIPGMERAISELTELSSSAANDAAAEYDIYQSLLDMARSRILQAAINTLEYNTPIARGDFLRLYQEDISEKQLDTRCSVAMEMTKLDREAVIWDDDQAELKEIDKEELRKYAYGLVGLEAPAIDTFYKNGSRSSSRSSSMIIADVKTKAGDPLVVFELIDSTDDSNSKCTLSFIPYISKPSLEE